MLQKTLSLNDAEIKLSGKKTGEFVGYASVFNGVDAYGDTIMPGAYKDTLALNPAPKMFLNHQHMDLPIGRWDLQEDNKGLFAHGQLTMDMQNVKDVYAALEAGTIDGLSIGYKLDAGDYADTDDGRIIERVSHLAEISIVTWPADEAARITDVKAAIEEIAELKDFERWLRDAANLTKGQAVVAVARAKALILSDSVKEAEAKELKAMAERFSRVGQRLG